MVGLVRGVGLPVGKRRAVLGLVMRRARLHYLSG
jgi:hypothetical protein